MQLHPLNWLNKASQHKISTSAEQEVLLKRAAQVSNLSLTDYILNSACSAAELAILDQRHFIVSGHERQKLLALQARPPQTNQELRQLMSIQSPWGGNSALHAPQALLPEHTIHQFDCGRLALNEWLMQRARQSQLQGLAKTFVVCAQQRVVAYFSLSVGQIDSLEMPRGHLHRDSFPVPVVLLTRPAVDKLYQAKGLGSAMLLESVRRTAAIAEQVGVEALLTQPINEKAARFYQSYGFAQSPAAYKQLLLMIHDIQTLLPPGA